MFSLFRSSVCRLFLLGLLMFFIPAHSQTEQTPAYINDALVVYLHSGPGNQFRIVGTLVAGTEVIMLNEENDYAQIQYDTNKTAWLPKEHLTFSPGLRAQLSVLQTTVTEQNAKILELEQANNQYQADLNLLSQERDKIQEELTESKRQNERLSTEISETQASFWQQPMVLGGAILLFGLLFGLLLPRLIPQRRNSERWM